jgi:hypothetical protein
VSSDEDFLPSEVTNRPEGILNEDPTSETNKELQMPMSTCSINLVKKSPSEGDEEEPKRARIYPSNIFSIPKVKITIKEKRTARRSEIMMCSPFGNSLLDVNKKGTRDSTRPKKDTL